MNKLLLLIPLLIFIPMFSYAFFVPQLNDFCSNADIWKYGYEELICQITVNTEQLIELQNQTNQKLDKLIEIEATDLCWNSDYRFKFTELRSDFDGKRITNYNWFNDCMNKVLERTK